MRQSSLVVVANRLPARRQRRPGRRLRVAAQPRRPGQRPAPDPRAHPGHLGRLGRRHRPGARRCPTSTASGCAPVALSDDDYATTTRASPTRPSGRSTTTRSSSPSSTAAGGRRTSGSTSASPRPPPRSPSPAPSVWVQDYHLQLVPGDAARAAPRPADRLLPARPVPAAGAVHAAARAGPSCCAACSAPTWSASSAPQARAQLRPARRPRCSDCAATDGEIARRRPGRRAPARSRSRSTSPRCEALAGRPDVVARAPPSCAPTSATRDRCILSVDRLDYTKGIEHRLKAYRELLRRRPGQGPRHGAWCRSRCRAGSGSSSYQMLRDRVEREVGRINGEFGRVGEPADPLPQPVVRPGRAGRALPGRRRHGGDPAARRHEPGRQGVRRRPGRRRRRAGAQRVRRRRRRAARRRTWSTRTTWTGSRTTLVQALEADPAETGRPDARPCARHLRDARHPGLGPLLPDRAGPHRHAGRPSWPAPDRRQRRSAGAPASAGQLLLQPVQDRVDRLLPAGVQHQVVAHAGEEQRRRRRSGGPPGPASAARHHPVVRAAHAPAPAGRRPAAPASGARSSCHCARRPAPPEPRRVAVAPARPAARG